MISRWIGPASGGDLALLEVTQAIKILSGSRGWGLSREAFPCC
ncbi:hypothetical protein [Cyanobium sp. LEGE 06143]|nr:hypothetical protein [Cyanobium sp. LEGE 06143]